MDNVGEVLKFLRLKDEYVSGDYISARLHVSRTAIWKYINQLERYGYGIDKSKGKGYKLSYTPDKLYPWEVGRFLDTTVFGNRIIHRDEADSTNLVAFRLALAGEPEGTCVIAEAQNKGKGRLGRRWSSPPNKNIYCSLIVRPAIHPAGVYPITFLSSLAVYDTITALTGEKPTLKWPNDVLINGKKVCGTLLELSTEADQVKFVVIGIGLNVNMTEEEMESEIREKASSLSMEAKKTFDRALVCGMLLSSLERYYLLFQHDGTIPICDAWEERAAVKGKYMEIAQMGETYRGVCEGIDSGGAIYLTVDGQRRKIIAGDVAY